jgi:hypothetical protein
MEDAPKEGGPAADLEASTDIRPAHVIEAISYRAAWTACYGRGSGGRMGVPGILNVPCSLTSKKYYENLEYLLHHVPHLRSRKWKA